MRAKELDIPVVERAIFLGWITQDYATVINIAGTHGKTTTTAMCALILMEANTDPTVHLGAELSAFGQSTVRMGEAHKLLVSEACEYSNSYHHFISTTAVILNIDLDHMDFFADADELVTSFAIFTDKIRDGGYLILPHSGAFIPQLVDLIKERRHAMGRALPTFVTYGGEGIAVADDEKVDIADWPDTPTVCWRNLHYKDGFPSLTSTLTAHSGQTFTSIYREPIMVKQQQAIAATYLMVQMPQLAGKF